MLFASASGLDPHISPEAAFLQLDRVAKARNFNNSEKQKLIQKLKELTEPPQLFCLGNERVNIFLLNLEADKIK
jgi:K+-transporting ATPase ATPase C chain